MKVVKASRTTRSLWKQQQETNRQLRSRSAFTDTGVHPNGLGGLDSDNYVPATSGFSLKGSTGVAEFKDIILYDLPNSMLANPTMPAVVNLRVVNFALSTGAYVEIAGADLTVPDGFTKLSFTGTSMMNAYNPRSSGGSDGTGSDWLYTRVGIGGTMSPSTTATGVSGNGGNATASNTYAQLLTGLTPGSTVRASAFGVCDYGIPADPINEMLLSATLTWWR